MNITVTPQAFPLWCANVADNQTIRATGAVVGWVSSHHPYPEGEVEDDLTEVQNIKADLSMEPVVAWEDPGDGYEYKTTQVALFHAGSRLFFGASRAEAVSLAQACISG